MCGIAGIVQYDKPVDRSRLEPMLNQIIHRGPDDVGRYDDDCFSIGMRRLSIIDLAGGHQPISNEDGSVWVVLNGEIYNYVELRSELESKGHQFKTRTDTEVLVHLYEEHGAAFPEYINGMFGIAVWDLRNQRVVLARDPLGIKPLFYSFRGSKLVFASELKCFLEAGGESLNLDRDAVAAYLHLGYIPHDHTPFEEIDRILPGHTLIYERGGHPRETCFWRLRDCFDNQVEGSSQSLAEEAAALLSDSVKLRLRSDVPVGTFLSGGIDSSCITVLANEQLPRIDTFSVGFKDHFFDETPYARMVAEKAGTTHHELIVDPSGMLDEFDRLVWHLDLPNWDPAMFPSYVICRYAREVVKVALSGNGGDELFAGYHRHLDPPPLDTPACRFRAAAPRAVRQAIGSALRKTGGTSGRRMADRLIPDNNVVGMCYWVDQANRSIMDAAMPWAGEQFSATGWVDARMEEVASADWLNKRLYYDSTTYLPDQILDMIDRSSMAVSLEVRVPFLDKRLVSFMAGIHGSEKTRDKQGKRLLQMAMADRLPEEIFTRRKLGFGLPVRNWILEPRIREKVMALTDGSLNQAGLINGSKLEPFLHKDEMLAESGAYIWTLMMLESWFRQFVEGKDRPSIGQISSNRFETKAGIA